MMRTTKAKCFSLSHVNWLRGLLLFLFASSQCSRFFLVCGSWALLPASRVVRSRSDLQLQQRQQQNIEMTASPNNNENQSQSPWDSLKSTVYDTVDTVASLRSKIGKDREQTEAEVVKLQPGKRLMTKYPRKPSSSQQQEQTKSTEIKNRVYNSADKISATLEAVTEAPEKAQNAALKAKQIASTIPQKIKTFEQEVTSIPGKVQSTAKDIQSSIERGVEEVTSVPGKVQSSIETGIETTQKVVDNVKAIPNTVQTKVSETKSSVEEAVYQAKVLVGMEEPIPKPPKVPPPTLLKKESASDIALKVAGTAATGTAKATWFVAKGALGLTGRLAQKAWESSREKNKDKEQQEEVLPLVVPLESSSNNKQQQQQATETTTKRNDDLDREIDEALRMAKKAMENANKVTKRIDDDEKS